MYFDSIYDRDFYEKVDGIELRRKIRLRCYSPQDTTAFLEMKQKQEDLQLKRSLEMSKEDAMALIQGNYDVLLPYASRQNPFPLECCALMKSYGYRPKTIVEYRRHAFIAKENKIRITFDHQICSCETNMDLFSDALPLHPVLDLSQAVLEVKYNGFLLNYIQDLLAPVSQSETSVSKYYLARQNACRTRME